MARKKTLEELRIEQTKLEELLKVKTQSLKALRQQEAELSRRERTHRLCTHGAMLEQYLRPEDFNDDQIAFILKTLFGWEETKVLLENARRQDEG